MTLTKRHTGLRKNGAGTHPKQNREHVSEACSKGKQESESDSYDSNDHLINFRDAELYTTVQAGKSSTKTDGFQANCGTTLRTFGCLFFSRNSASSCNNRLMSC